VTLLPDTDAFKAVGAPGASKDRGPSTISFEGGPTPAALAARTRTYTAVVNVTEAEKEVLTLFVGELATSARPGALPASIK
jgi:hypothetical protein